MLPVFLNIAVLLFNTLYGFSDLVQLYGKQIVYSIDGSALYPEAWTTLGLKHRLHSTF